jgi:hypothetical protein
MGLAMDCVGGAVTETAVTTFVAVTPGTGDSFTVKGLSATGMAYLETIGRNGAHTGRVRVRSTLLHDDVQGIRFMLPTGVQYVLGSEPYQQPLRSLDNLILECTGTAADVDTAAMMIYYTDVVGGAANLAMPADLAGRVKNIVTVEVATTAGATVGNWGDTALNATIDLLHASSSYAVLGYMLDTALTAVAIRGIDTSNMRCAGPGVALSDYTQYYFVSMSERTGRPHIPIIQANNKASTFVSTLASTASLTSNVSLILAELSS